MQPGAYERIHLLQTVYFTNKCERTPNLNESTSSLAAPFGPYQKIMVVVGHQVEMNFMKNNKRENILFVFTYPTLVVFNSTLWIGLHASSLPSFVGFAEYNVSNGVVERHALARGCV